MDQTELDVVVWLCSGAYLMASFYLSFSHTKTMSEYLFVLLTGQNISLAPRSFRSGLTKILGLLSKTLKKRIYLLCPGVRVNENDYNITENHIYFTAQLAPLHV